MKVRERVSQIIRKSRIKKMEPGFYQSFHTGPNPAISSSECITVEVLAHYAAGAFFSFL